MTGLAFLLLAASLAGGVSPQPEQAAPGMIHQPAEQTPEERHEILREMWKRRLLSPKLDRWTEADRELMEKMRFAEKAGAFDLLRAAGPLAGLAVEDRIDGKKELFLTKRGFYRYQFLKSQKARKYFEDQGTDAKFIFLLRDTKGKRIFDPRGQLTPAGEALFDDILRGKFAQWRDSAGRTVGNSGR